MFSGSTYNNNPGLQWTDQGVGFRKAFRKPTWNIVIMWWIQFKFLVVLADMLVMTSKISVDKD